MKDWNKFKDEVQDFFTPKDELEIKPQSNESAKEYYNSALSKYQSLGKQLNKPEVMEVDLSDTTSITKNSKLNHSNWNSSFNINKVRRKPDLVKVNQKLEIKTKSRLNSERRAVKNLADNTPIRHKDYVFSLKINLENFKTEELSEDCWESYYTPLSGKFKL